MLIGVYGDVHLTKNMRTLQSEWDVTATKSIYHMYDRFDELNVESVICLGDFFDAPRIEAKHMQLVMPILRHMNERTYPTYLLLGNHEIDSEESNILDFLHMYDNIIPVTTPTDIEGMLFLPYGTDPSEFNMRDKIVFTHHDIYGSQLAGGKTTAFFGIDPSVFFGAKLVMNGHVHLRSNVAGNILNAGSILVSQQGELVPGQYPLYYTVDTMTGHLSRYENKHTLIYLTIDESDIERISVSEYDKSHLVLKVEYAGDIPSVGFDTLHTSYRKLVTDIKDNHEDIVRDSNFDLKNYLTQYIKDDASVSDKEGYIAVGMRLLG